MAQHVKATVSGRPSEWFSQWFWPFVDRSSQFGCWTWIGRSARREIPSNLSYGVVAIEGEDVLAHRLAWMITYGSTRGLSVLHKCDNRPCVNPAHLYIGTREMNTQDAVARGRQCDWQISDDGDFSSWYDDDSLRDLLLDTDLRDEYASYATTTVQRKRFDLATQLVDRTIELSMIETHE